jgi:oligopeptidase B
MKVKVRMIMAFCGLVLIQSCNMKQPVKPPVAERKPVELKNNGHTRIDPYYWLRERDNPEVIAYLKAENAYREKMTEGTAAFQEALFREITGRIKQDDESVPYLLNGYYYYTRYEEGKEYPVYCRKKESLEAGEEIMANVNEMAKGYAYYQVGGLSVSPDNQLAAIAIDTLSRRIYEIRFKDLQTGEMLPDLMHMASTALAWSADGKYLFYTKKDEETLRSGAVYRHEMGTDESADVSVYEESDETFSTYVYKTKSREFLVIGSSSTLTDEYRILSAGDPLGEFRVIQPRDRGLEYSISHFGKYFYILTNLDATNFRLMRTPVDRTTKDHWEEVIPHREDVFLQGLEIFAGYMVLEERREGLIRLRVIPWDGSPEHYVEMEEEVYTAWISVNPEFDNQVLRYGYSSLTTPSSTIDYNMATREKTLMKREEVVGGDFSPENYEARRLYATARDGKKVPLSLVYRKGLHLDGSNPTLIYGYGSYGFTRDPSFSSARLSLLDRGFVYAIAHIRGSQVYGRPWYEDGKLLNKRNTFTDFIDCSEFLVEEGYTSPEHLFAMGGSAGGLLMGAVVNMRPDLYRGVVAAVPFVDVVTTMLDEDIPLTTGEYDEWGNPHEEEYYRYMLSYSPYDQVEAKEYPNMLVTTGLHDSQVQYWEPAKWVAKLRYMKTGDNLLLLYCNMDTGHGGASGRFEQYRETAMEYAFLLSLEGIDK